MLGINKLYIMDNLCTPEYFHAVKLDKLKDRCSNLAYPIRLHLAKCYLFPNTEYLTHWIREINNWISDLATTGTKGGSFKYSYIFESLPVKEQEVNKLIDSTLNDEDKLKPLTYDWKGLLEFLREIRSQIYRLSNNSKRILNNIEIQIIILNALRKFKRIQ